MIFPDVIMASDVTVASQRVGALWTWYIIRAAGFTAAGLIVLLMLSGIGQVTGLTFRFIEPIKAWIVHKTLAYALLIAITIHIGFLLIDHYIHFSVAQLFIPFLSTYNNKTQLPGLPLGKFAVSFGVLALYGVIIVVLSSLYWIDSKKRRWKLLHYISYVVALLVFLHALYAGSDIRYGLFRTAWIGLGVIVTIGVIMRLARVGSLKRKKSVIDEDAVNDSVITTTKNL
jgi:sulfoxide reductase heme-binding subunit YedZ